MSDMCAAWLQADLNYVFWTLALHNHDYDCHIAPTFSGVLQ